MQALVVDCFTTPLRSWMHWLRFPVNCPNSLTWFTINIYMYLIAELWWLATWFALMFLITNTEFQAGRTIQISELRTTQHTSLENIIKQSESHSSIYKVVLHWIMVLIQNLEGLAKGFFYIYVTTLNSLCCDSCTC